MLDRDQNSKRNRDRKHDQRQDRSGEVSSPILADRSGDRHRNLQRDSGGGRAGGAGARVQFSAPCTEARGSRRLRFLSAWISAHPLICHHSSLFRPSVGLARAYAPRFEKITLFCTRVIRGSVCNNNRLFDVDDRMSRRPHVGDCISRGALNDIFNMGSRVTAQRLRCKL
ncbi:hypothetical protein EVAR_23073_1 [Eumeta japonica]|uniref:Uncharacterized protein n=1 Tax=Eumeta variegata TaxID=151549 RepID=A0A4C1VKW5_EUMVA|nr:hypothetical protein EVAR_23073_1 [Eumeta japonica]